MRRHHQPPTWSSTLSRRYVLNALRRQRQARLAELGVVLLFNLAFVGGAWVISTLLTG